MISEGPAWSPGLKAAALTLVLCAGWISSAGAQWQVEAAAGGVSHEATGGAVSTSSAILGIRHEGPSWAYLSTGVPLSDDGLPWLAGGAGARLGHAVGRVRFGLDIGGQAHGFRAPDTRQTGGGVILDALPFVGASLGTARLEARSGIVHYSSRFLGETISRTLHESGLTAELRPDRRLSVSAEGSVLRAEEGDYPWLGAAAELSLSPVTLWANAGRWTSSAMPDPAWGAGAVLDVGRRYALRASYQQEATDPLFWNETRRFWSVGVTARMGPTSRGRLIAPVLPQMSPAGVVFRIPAVGHDAPPSVAGDFNGWTPVQMGRVGDEWMVAIPVPPGVHRYSFRRADGSWFVPATVENRMDDGFGGTNAVLVVPSPDGS